MCVSCQDGLVLLLCHRVELVDWQSGLPGRLCNRVELQNGLPPLLSNRVYLAEWTTEQTTSLSSTGDRVCWWKYDFLFFFPSFLAPIAPKYLKQLQNAECMQHKS